MSSRNSAVTLTDRTTIQLVYGSTDPTDMEDEMDALTEHRARKQADTVKRLNGLSPHNNDRVQASAVDAEATKLCDTDSAHGTAPVVFICCGELSELCDECGIDVLRMMTEDAAVGDVIDVEVYR